MLAGQLHANLLLRRPDVERSIILTIISGQLCRKFWTRLKCLMKMYWQTSTKAVMNFHVQKEHIVLSTEPSDLD
jgi:hypothetical protein